MKKIISLFFLIIAAKGIGQKSITNSDNVKIESNMNIENIYQFKVNNIEGNEFDFSSLKGKKIMIVNTASECGLTPQYKQLQELYEEYKTKNLVIIGFPANNFGHQEPGTNASIATFCTKNYGVTFPMMEKIAVIGDEMHPLYHFLTEKSKNGLEDSTVSWNFQKYLINEEGYLEKIIAPQVQPNDKSVMDWINNVK